MPKLSKNKNLPAAITNIRLCSALRNCGSLGVENAFVKSKSNHLFVYDDRTIGYTDWTDAEPDFPSKCFNVLNPNGLIIVLLPLDNRIITGANTTKGGICDGMLLTEREMCLIEFKTDVTSSNNETIEKRAEGAINQLWHTYDGIIHPRCANVSIAIDHLLSVDFHVVFDKDLEIIGVNAALMDMQVQFHDDKKFSLYFDNEKRFE